MDKIDLQIIEELKFDSRKPFKKIAEKLGVSTQTVINRYNKMLSSNIIKSNSISIDLKKLGYIGTLHMFLEFTPSVRPSEIVRKLAKMNNVIVASKASGDYEGYAISVFRDVEDMYRQVIKIKRLSGVANLEYFFAIPGFEYFPSPNILHQKQ